MLFLFLLLTRSLSFSITRQHHFGQNRSRILAKKRDEPGYVVKAETVDWFLKGGLEPTPVPIPTPTPTSLPTTPEEKRQSRSRATKKARSPKTPPSKKSKATTQTATPTPNPPYSKLQGYSEPAELLPPLSTFDRWRVSSSFLFEPEDFEFETETEIDEKFDPASLLYDPLTNDIFSETPEEPINPLTITSERLDFISSNSIYKTCPTPISGFDRMWVAAVDAPIFDTIAGTFNNYGVEFCENIADVDYVRSPSSTTSTIEEIASAKAHRVFEATNLPTVADRTSFEISASKSGSTIAPSNSAYFFDDLLTPEVDQICEVLKPFSLPDRVTRYKTVLCYYDGEIELFAYGECEVDMIFSNSNRAFISHSHACDYLSDMLSGVGFLDMEFKTWAKKKEEIGSEESSSSRSGSAAKRLASRVLKDGVVTSDGFLSLSKFIGGSNVDVSLLDECAKELSRFYENSRITKIVCGQQRIILASLVAKYLNVPLDIGGDNKEIGNILLVDEFLGTGGKEKELIRVVKGNGGDVIGAAFAVEEGKLQGRETLNLFSSDLVIKTLCVITSTTEGIIEVA